MNAKEVKIQFNTVRQRVFPYPIGIPLSGVYRTRVIGAREYDGGSPELYIFKAQIARIERL